jgi:hypothetical protein
MAYSKANFGETTLASAITTTDGTTITVTSGTSFPVVPFLVTIDTEILKCTDKGAGTNWTVTRGEQSSTAATHLNGTKVQNNITAGDFSSLVEGPASATDAHLAVFDYTTGKLIKDGGACTAAGLALLDDANATAQIATLGLDADIATLSLPASTTITAAGAALIDDANAAAQLATLGAAAAAHTHLLAAGATDITATVAEVNKLAGLTTTAAELVYVHGVTSAIQTQLGTKVAGCAYSLDHAAVRWDGATGKLVQDSNLIISDAGQVTVTQDNVDGAQLMVRGFTNNNKQIFFGVDTTNNIGILYAIFQGSDYMPLDLRGKVVCTSLSGFHVGGTSDPGDNNLYVDNDCSALTFTDRP